MIKDFKDIKMVVTDLDGTLLLGDKTISDNTKEVIAKLKEEGILFGIATARPLRSVKNFLPFLEYDFAIYHNGAVITCDDELIDGYGIENPLDIVNKLRSALPGCNICMEANDMMYSSFKSEEIWPGFEYVATTDFHEVKDFVGDKVIVEAGSKKELAQIEAVLPDDLYAVLSENQVVMIMNKKATKLNAIRLVAKKYGISINDVLAFGDDYNDIEMLKGCGTGVAVGNALDEVKQAADYVALSNEEDGEALWIKQHCLDK